MTAVIKRVVDGNGGEHRSFRCPGCGDHHEVRISGAGPSWSFNEDEVRPTFSPSLFVTSGHFVAGHDGGRCWCTYNAERPDKPAPFTCYRCHSFIDDGQIQFLGDCTHDLAGQTVPLPPINEPAS